MIWLLSCSSDTPDATDSHTLQWKEELVSELSTDLFYRRASLDLRGVIPTANELDAWSTLSEEAVIQHMLEDHRHENRLRSLFAEWLLTQVEQFNLKHSDYGLPDEQAYHYLRSIGEEPLRLMAHVGSKDLPWTEIVTADYTMANRLLMDIWPLIPLVEPSETSPDWLPAQYTDGRPPGGVLMTNGLWWRYYTTPNNNNRSRAAQLSNLFLCENLLQRPIRFSATALIEADNINNVVKTDPACIGCHNVLDPLASVFFGFWWFDIYDVSELSSYHPEREFLGEEALEQPMSYFGQPMNSPADLGSMVAQDGRFISCTVTRIAEMLWKRELAVEDFNLLVHLQDEFKKNNLRFSALLKEVVLTSTYRAHFTLDESNTPIEHRLKLLQPDQLHSSIEALTGFTWTDHDRPLLMSDNNGYRQMLGGVDGIEITSSSKTPNLSHQLVIHRLSQHASLYWVEANWESITSDPSDLLSTPLSLALPEELLPKLYKALYSEDITPDELEQLLLFFEEAKALSTAQEAWAALLSVLLRSPRYWSY